LNHPTGQPVIKKQAIIAGTRTTFSEKKVPGRNKMGRAINAVVNAWTRSEDLVQVALGQQYADLVIKGGLLIDVFGGKIRQADIAIKGMRIALVGNVDHVISETTRVIDATGFYISPGLIDPHVHIEASMVTPTQFARAVLPKGNTAVLWETLWTGNTLGVEGIKFFLNEARQTPLKVFATAASGVPPISPGLATPAYHFNLDEMQELLEMDQVLTLGEILHVNEVLLADPVIHTKIRMALDRKKQVEGSIAGYREKFSAFTAAGVTSDHEAVTVEDAVDRILSGMRLFIREGSGLHNLPETIKAITEHNLSTRRVCFCVDDKDLRDIVETGTIDYLVREAIRAGVDPLVAVQMGSLNAAEYMRVDNVIGGIAPGMIADIILVKSLEDFQAHTVIVNGEIIARNGRLTINLQSPPYPPTLTNTVRINRALTPGDFFYTTNKENSVKVRLIRMLPDQDFSFEEIEVLPVENGEIILPEDPSRDILKLVMIERHGKTPGPNIAKGFIKGFGVRDAALAACIAPDINQMILIGSSTADLVKAANRVVELQGGIVISKNEEILAELPMPVAGFMSGKPYEELIPALEKLHQVVKGLGCAHPSPFMTMALVGAVGGHPYLKISDKGLVDIIHGVIVPLEVEE
jgi:adenine deaminase